MKTRKMKRDTTRMSFSKRTLAALKCARDARTYVYDIKVPGLALCVTATGTKSFYVCRRAKGRPVRVRLGGFPELSVEQARRRASEVNYKIATGGDPQAEQRTAKGEMTLRDLFEYYLEIHAKPHKRTWPEDERQFRCYLSQWHKRKLSEIRRADVIALHKKLGGKNGPYMANRVVALLSKMFNLAADVGFEKPNPASRVKKYREHHRDRYMNADELKQFFKALRDEPDPLFRDYFTIALLTGARRANTMAMRWDDIDLERGIWRIPETESKSGEPMLCVLPPQAVDLLRRRQATEPGQGEYVFPSSGGSGHLESPKKAWNRILERAGIKDLHIHDLRRTLGSWQASLGTSLAIIGRSLGHKSLQATQIYARLDMESVRKSVDAAAVAMLSAAEDVKEG